MENLKKQYDELVSNIASKRIYDGRGKGVDVYVCERCGHEFYTRYKDKGVTPFVIKCRNCDKGEAVHEKTIYEEIAIFLGYKVLNWVRPTFEQLQKLNEGEIQHVLQGELMLEDELKNSNV